MLDRLNALLADRYSVERELGRGGMASVWLARELAHGRPVALKVLHPELAGAIGVDRFVREIRVTARLQHPNIVPVLDSGVLPGADGVALPWYAMAYIPGESLRARLDREPHVPVDEALRITEEAADALGAAHREGIVHRDIKPGNLLLAGGHVYVADFGIAKAMVETGAERLTSTGLALGTPSYMSPEQAAAQPVDARTDQYSLACVLYEMLAGEPPFTGPTAQAIVARRLAESPRAIRPVRPSVPAAVEAATLRALERVPADRFPDMTAFAAALRAPPTAEQPAREPARAARRRLVPAAAVGGLLVLAALGAWLTRGHAGTAQTVRDSAAVALYRRGLREYDRRTPGGTAEAIRSFTAAVERDSTYAAAWAGLANAYIRALGRGFVFPGAARDSVLRLAVAAVDRALALDDRSAETWLTRGIVSRNIDPTDAAPALRSLRQALALDSANARAWNYLAIGLAESAEMDEALDAWRRSVASDPRYTEGLAFLALGHYWRRQYDSAARWADSAVAVDPAFLLGWQSGAAIALEQRKFARARAGYEAARRLSTDIEIPNAVAGIAMADAGAGDTAGARKALGEAEALAAAYTPPVSHTVVWLAQAHAALGQTGPAVAWLRRSPTPQGVHFQLHLRCDAAFDPIADDPGFRALLLTPRPAQRGGC